MAYVDEGSGDEAVEPPVRRRRIGPMVSFPRGPSFGFYPVVFFLFLPSRGLLLFLPPLGLPHPPLKRLVVEKITLEAYIDGDGGDDDNNG